MTPDQAEHYMKLSAENGRLRARVQELEDINKVLWTNNDGIHARCEKLEKALEFYANEGNYNSEGAPCNDPPSEDNGGFPTDYDRGERARKALQRPRDGAIK